MSEQQPNSAATVRPTRVRARLRDVRTRMQHARARARAARGAEDRYFDEQRTAAWLLWRQLPATRLPAERVEVLDALADSATAMSAALAVCDDLVDAEGRTSADWARDEARLVQLVCAAERAVVAGTVRWDRHLPADMPDELVVAAAPVCRMLTNGRNDPHARAQLLRLLHTRVVGLVGAQAGEILPALADAYPRPAGGGHP